MTHFELTIAPIIDPRTSHLSEEIGSLCKIQNGKISAEVSTTTLNPMLDMGEEEERRCVSVGKAQ